MRAQDLSDNFNEGYDSSKWNQEPSTGTISFVNNEVEFTSSTSSGYNQVESVNSYDLTSSYVFAQLVNAGNQSIPSLEAILYWFDVTNNNKVFFLVGDGGSIAAYKVVAGVQSQVASGTYNSSTHKWLRIRESGGTIYWDYSTDGITWTNFTSLANPFAITSGRLAMQQGTWQTETLTSVVKWDNLNINRFTIPAPLIINQAVNRASRY